MADNTPLTTEGARYLYGATSPADCAVDTATAVAKGDIVCLSSGKIVPATAFATKALAAAAFAGISGQTKAAGDAQIRGNTNANRIRIDTDGVFSIPCADACDVGDALGIKLNGGATAALAGEVAKTTTDNEKIAICVEPKTASETHVKCRILSKKFGPRAILV